MKSSNRIPRHDWKNHTKFVTLNATFRILKVNATGNGHRGCIYFENLQNCYSSLITGFYIVLRAIVVVL